MIREVIIAGLFICAAWADLRVLHHPESLDFKPGEKDDVLTHTVLKEIFAAALGFSVKPNEQWKRLYIKDPFALPEAFVGISVEGSMDTLKLKKGKMYPLEKVWSEELIWQALNNKIMRRDNKNLLRRIELSDGYEQLGQSSVGELKPTELGKETKTLNSTEDLKFFNQISLLHSIADEVERTVKKDGKPDVFWFVLTGLQAVIDAHKDDPEDLRIIKENLENVTAHIVTAFNKTYDGSVMVASFTYTPVGKLNMRSANYDSLILNRHIRDTGNTADPPNEENKLVESSTQRFEEETDYRQIMKLPEAKDMNLAEKYDENYPVIFNIILWFCVIFFFSLYAACILIAQMDPGRDSVIYRMTSSRIKKDN